MLKLNELVETLKPYGKITILGHDNIDVDAFFSGVLFSNLLKFLGIDCEFVILEKVVKNDSYHIVKDLSNIDMNDYYCDTEDDSRKLFLEDHYKTVHKGEVIACIDHHPTSEEIRYPFYYSRRSCSTSYMVYELMKQANYEITRDEAKIIISSMMVDTVSFRSSKTVPEEVIKARELANMYDLDYEALEKYCLCLTPLEVSDEAIINNGFKYYNYKGNKVKSSYIQAYEMVDDKKIDNWIYLIKTSLSKEELSMWVFIVFACKDNETYVYCVEKHGTLKFKYHGILSRGTNIMPKIEKMFLR